jgi:hypothetical protein
VLSERGRGATFLVCFPIAVVAEPAPAVV